MVVRRGIVLLQFNLFPEWPSSVYIELNLGTLLRLSFNDAVWHKLENHIMIMDIESEHAMILSQNMYVENTDA
jgi:hypothetical protein